jgi:hypothetical protein
MVVRILRQHLDVFVVISANIDLEEDHIREPLTRRQRSTNRLTWRSSLMRSSPIMLYRTLCAAAVFVLFTSVSPCQSNSLADPTQSIMAQKTEDIPPPIEGKRILGIIPNFRTSPSLQNYEPLTPREKFKEASEDALDRGTFALAALVGGLNQMSNSNRSFGQGAAGFARYFGASYGDWVIGDYMTQGVFPTLLHQDPRYFRRSIGSGWSRLGYAVGQIFWTRRDSGGTQFNYSEVIGNSTAVAISNAYYADNRTATNAVSSLGLQLGVDMACNIAREFWPDFQRKLKRKHHVK